MEFEDHGYTMQISDLIRTWKEQVKQEDVIKKSQEITTGSIDVSRDSDVEFILTKVKNLMQGDDDVLKKNITAAGGAIIPTLKVTIDLSPVPDSMDWRFDLVQTDEVEHQKMIQGFVDNLIDRNKLLSSSVNELTDVIYKKDYHIKSLKEQVTDLGTKYKPHRYKQASNEEFDKEKWWEGKQAEYAGNTGRRLPSLEPPPASSKKRKVN